MSKLEIIKNDMLACKELTPKRRQMLIALSATNGNVLQASIAAGVSREVHTEGMLEPNYVKFYERILEDDLDWWEGQLHKLGEKEDFNAIKLHLQSKGKKRGYRSDSNSVNVSIAPVTFNLVLMNPEVKQLDTPITESIELKQTDGTSDEGVQDK